MSLNSSKLLALLSTGALVLSSMGGMLVNSGSALAHRPTGSDDSWGMERYDGLSDDLNVFIVNPDAVSWVDTYWNANPVNGYGLVGSQNGVFVDARANYVNNAAFDIDGTDSIDVTIPNTVRPIGGNAGVYPRREQIHKYTVPQPGNDNQQQSVYEGEKDWLPDKSANASYGTATKDTWTFQITREMDSMNAIGDRIGSDDAWTNGANTVAHNDPLRDNGGNQKDLRLNRVDLGYDDSSFGDAYGTSFNLFAGLGYNNGYIGDNNNWEFVDSAATAYDDQYNFGGYDKGNTWTTEGILDDLRWESSDPSVIQIVDMIKANNRFSNWNDGIRCVAKKPGTATIRLAIRYEFLKDYKYETWTDEKTLTITVKGYDDIERITVQKHPDHEVLNGYRELTDNNGQIDLEAEVDDVYYRATGTPFLNPLNFDRVSWAGEGLYWDANTNIPVVGSDAIRRLYYNTWTGFDWEDSVTHWNAHYPNTLGFVGDNRDNDLDGVEDGDPEPATGVVKWGNGISTGQLVSVVAVTGGDRKTHIAAYYREEHLFGGVVTNNQDIDRVRWWSDNDRGSNYSNKFKEGSVGGETNTTFNFSNFIEDRQTQAVIEEVPAFVGDAATVMNVLVNNFATRAFEWNKEEKTFSTVAGAAQPGNDVIEVSASAVGGAAIAGIAVGPKTAVAANNQIVEIPAKVVTVNVKGTAAGDATVTLTGKYYIGLQAYTATISFPVKIGSNNEAVAPDNGGENNNGAIAVGSTFTKDGNLYRVSAGNNLTLVKYLSNAAAAVVPSEVEEGGVKYTVTKIGAKAFTYREGVVTSVVVPASVTKIGNGAFKGCSKLTSIEIQGVVTVGKNVLKKVGAVNVTLAAGNSAATANKLRISDPEATVTVAQ